MTSVDTRRTARLLGLAPTRSGLRVARVRRFPPAPVRFVEALTQRRGGEAYERRYLASLVAEHRRAGTEGMRGPRFLVRVDEFPTYSGYDDARYGLESSTRFHAVMAQAGLRYLMAVVPQWTHAPLDPGADGGRDLDDADRALIERMRADGVTFGQHGDTHRSRYVLPRQRSELCGLSNAALAAVLDRGRQRLAESHVEPQVFVAPFNRFDARQWPVLASRYEVVTGGPECVLKIGFHGGPQWRDDAVYLPGYAPFYATAATVLPAAEAAIAGNIPAWIPIVLHTGWEEDDRYVGLTRLAERIAPHTSSWEDFLDAVRQSRHG